MVMLKTMRYLLFLIKYFLLIRDKLAPLVVLCLNFNF